MHGRWGESEGDIIRQVVALCANPEKEDRINVTFSIDETHVTIMIDPQDLPQHPERRSAIPRVLRRSLGIDLNPNWIGLSVVENKGNPSLISETRLMDHELVKLDLPKDASAELVRETLAAVCDRAIRSCRKYGVGLICLEKGLGKLRSSGRNRSLNRALNYWARTIFIAMLKRKAQLAGIDVVEVWGGYSSTIGNVAFEVPDACASAAEIARRGLSRLAGKKDVLPDFEEGCIARRWKNEQMPAELNSWIDVHRTIKSTGLGYRRPHPDIAKLDSDGRSHGHAVHRLRHRKRPGWRFTPAPNAAMIKTVRDSSVRCVKSHDSTRKSE